MTDWAAERDRRLQWLALWRLIIGALLLGGTLWLNLSAGAAPDGFSSVFLSSLAVLTFAGSAIVPVSRLAGWPPSLRTGVPLIADLVLATGLVYLTGGAGSALSILYGASVLGAALALGRRAATLAAAASIVLYVGLSLGLVSGWVPPPPDQDPASYAPELQELGFSMLSNVVGLVVVGGLSIALAGRLQREHGLARTAERERIRLGQLNDDIVQSLSSGLVTLGEGERITSINASGLQLLGVEEHEALGQSIRSLLGFMPEMQTRAETIATLPDGRTMVVGYSRTPLLEAEGRSLLLFQDLTEIAGLREAAKRSERLAVLGHLAAGLAHEIRNPLGSIRGSVQLVRESGTLDEEDATLLDLVHDEVMRLNELVTTMLAVGQPNHPRPEQVDLAELVREVAQLARADSLLLADRRIDVEADQPLQAEVDPDAIRQVIWNLLKNALQASPERGRVTVRVRREDDEVVLEVEDQGEGVAESERAKLFDVFYSTRARGVGLGLALVHQIVRSHEGAIAIDAGVDGGALFRVTLPLRFAGLLEGSPTHAAHP